MDGLSLSSASLIPGGSSGRARPAGKLSKGTSNDLSLVSIRFDCEDEQPQDSLGQRARTLAQTDLRG